MRFLADEDVYAITIRWLREHGHDVVAVFEGDRRGTADGGVWAWAATDSRILVTRDKEFGRRFLAEPSAGLILLRGEFDEMEAVHSVLAGVLDSFNATEMTEWMFVVTPGRYRRRHRPSPAPSPAR